MQITITQTSGQNIAEITSSDIILASSQDAVDLLGNCSYQGASKIVLHQENISDTFFDLKTGMAGEILQKFSNYRCQLAIVGDFSKYSSKSLKDFIYESNRTGRINFVSSMEEARKSLSKKNG